ISKETPVEAKAHIGALCFPPRRRQALLRGLALRPPSTNLEEARCPRSWTPFSNVTQDLVMEVRREERDEAAIKCWPACTKLGAAGPTRTNTSVRKPDFEIDRAVTSER